MIDENHNARVADFGLSTIYQESQNEEPGEPSGPGGSQGAVRWLAPEYIVGCTGGKKHKPGDVYAWGCVVIEVSSSWCF